MPTDNQYDQLFDQFGMLQEMISSQQSKIAVLWILSRFCQKIKHSPYMINRYVQEYTDKQSEFNSEFKLQLINSTIFVFLKLPKETLPILSKLYRSVMNNEKESLFIKQKL